MGPERFASISAGLATHSPFCTAAGTHHEEAHYRLWLRRLSSGRSLAQGRPSSICDHAQSVRAEQFVQQGWKPVLCDITQPAGIELPAVDVAVIAVGFDRSGGPAMREVYVDGLENVLRRLSPDARCIYVSSTSVYGQATGELVDENAETTPQESSGQIVLAAERVLQANRPRATILRFAGIYGPGRLLREQALRENKPIVASPDRWLNLIQVEDGVSAIEMAEVKGEPGSIYNVADDEPVKRIDFFSRLAELLGAPPPHFEPPSGGALPLPAISMQMRMNWAWPWLIKLSRVGASVHNASVCQVGSFLEPRSPVHQIKEQRFNCADGQCACQDEDCQDLKCPGTHELLPLIRPLADPEPFALPSRKPIAFKGSESAETNQQLESRPVAKTSSSSGEDPTYDSADE